MQGVEHDEAISIYALQMRVRRLLRHHYLSTPPLTMTPRNDNSNVFQRPLMDISQFSNEILTFSVVTKT